ncbi:MAG: hypothetical protein ACM34L_05885 [Gemmatimonas sp.]|nr:hypothetical protein [Gemmatimonadaceae bacterium]
MRWCSADAHNYFIHQDEANTDSMVSNMKGSRASGSVVATRCTELVRGFGLIKGALIDQHFVRRRRHNRFISAVLDTPFHLGVAIDESTALIVHPDGHRGVLGESAASIYVARHAKLTPPGPPVLGESGLILSVLPSGSSYYPATGKVVLPH